eukprot:SAG31_NODE_15694_length_742_cov_1.810264_1_plen_76_part_00
MSTFDSANRAVQEEAFLSSALLSGTVYELYYKCPIEQMANHAACVPVLPDIDLDVAAAERPQLLDRASGAAVGRG